MTIQLRESARELAIGLLEVTAPEVLMSIRRRLLTSLLAIPLVPLIAGPVFHRFSMWRLGRRLAAGTREALEADADGGTQNAECRR